jgi:dienelactone hydrolase
MTGLAKVPLRHGDKVLEGQITVPDGPGPHPAVLVIHNAFGLGEQVRETALRLAGEGFVALACDMYGDGFYSEDHGAVAEVITALWQDGGLLRSRINAWCDLLKSRDDVDVGRVAVLGYCFGGQCALELARSGADVTAAISLHGLLSTTQPAEPGAVKAYIAIYTGAKDPHVPAEHVTRFREEMAAAANARWQITEFGDAHHAFTDREANSPERGRDYNRLADRVSWHETLGLLRLFAETRSDL